MDAGLVTPCAGSAPTRKVRGLTLRPLPKTVAPVPDELLTGWLTRLAATNYCAFLELLAHVEIEGWHSFTLDFELEATAAERIAVAARVDPAIVQSLTFPALSLTEAVLTARIPFQSCPECSRRGLALKHWRRAWAFDCQICGTRLAPIVAKPYGELLPEKLLRRARIGAGLLEQAATCNGTVRLRRAMQAVTFAMAIKNVRGDPAFALQSFNQKARLFFLAAIAAAQKRPLVKAALFSANGDDFSRVALLRAYQKEPRLIAAVDHICVAISAKG
ncbi:TniQ family protein [Mesorhizobium sp. CCNWLW179-1]|uniref:TniQ family protein n=1 Tax=unclassified Mesorhizobium TaxID=325217 RepID=UPI00301525BD